MKCKTEFFIRGPTFTPLGQKCDAAELGKVGDLVVMVFWKVFWLWITRLISCYGFQRIQGKQDGIGYYSCSAVEDGFRRIERSIERIRVSSPFQMVILSAIGQLGKLNGRKPLTTIRYWETVIPFILRHAIRREENGQQQPKQKQQSQVSHNPNPFL